MLKVRVLGLSHISCVPHRYTISVAFDDGHQSVSADRAAKVVSRCEVAVLTSSLGLTLGGPLAGITALEGAKIEGVHSDGKTVVVQGQRVRDLYKLRIAAFEMRGENGEMLAHKEFPNRLSVPRPTSAPSRDRGKSQGASSSSSAPVSPVSYSSATGPAMRPASATTRPAIATRVPSQTQAQIYSPAPLTQTLDTTQPSLETKSG
jgi:hypothetical protein